MRAIYKTVATSGIALAGAAAMGVAPVVAPPVALAAARTVLVMGGTGTPDPDAEVGYVPNIMSYYVNTQAYCAAPANTCTPQAVVTPETAWPLYGGLSALTWQQSILQGTTIYDTAVRDELDDEDAQVVLFGYSQSGAILAIEKRALADSPDKDRIKIVVIGNVSRPNGGLNARLPITIPIVQFPYGPAMPTDTGIETTDIALKWDIIADAPLYVLNPLAMLNALMGGPGFGIIHGTYPNPEGDPATGLIGGYTQEEWQAIMDDPEGYEELHPGTVEIEQVDDTKYITVTPKILPLVQPLHTIGLKPIADLIEPALRVIIEETGYDRDLSYGAPTTFRLIPIFNPVTLAFDLIPAIEQGVNQFVDDLGGATMTTTNDNTFTTNSVAASDDSTADDVVTPLRAGVDEEPVVEEVADTTSAASDTSDSDTSASDTNGTDTADAEAAPRPHIFRPFQRVREQLHNLFHPDQAADSDSTPSADNDAPDETADSTDPTDTGNAPEAPDADAPSQSQDADAA